MPAKKKNRSPEPPKSLKKNVKITSPERRRLKRLPKKDLQQLSLLAGEIVDEKDTKSILAHRLSRNQKIALGLGATTELSSQDSCNRGIGFCS